MGDSWLALACATEIDRLGQGLPIDDRRVIPYFSNILLNSAQELRGKVPTEPPLRAFNISQIMPEYNLFKTAQLAYDLKITTGTTVAEAYSLAAERLEQTAITIRNYRKLSPEQLSSSRSQLSKLFKSLLRMEETGRVCCAA